MLPAIHQYIRDIAKSYTTGDATEHTYRPALKAMVESFAKDVTATNEPKRTRCGAPDFIVNIKDAPVGFIECKDVDASLDKAEKTDQLKRYFASLTNLILTDYLEFRYYISGQPTIQVTLARLDANGRIKPLSDADNKLTNLFNAFLNAQTKTIATPKDLAARMAGIAKVIRDAIERAFEVEDQTGTLHGEYESFRATILNEITPEQFADMYAQTVCYGMFSARVNVPDNKAASFSREHAAYDLPATNPFLREVFDYIAGTKLDPSIVWAVDLLADILRRCDMGEILSEFGKAIRQEDPVVHFYETFLAAYDPALREKRGVYYTPEPVVSYIVRSIDSILKQDFACPEGLADHSMVAVEAPDARHRSGTVRREVHRVQILDPATGTGTFLYETIRLIHESFAANRGAWAGENGYVARHLLPRLFGFELMMAPYAVAHMKLGWLLKDTHYDFAAAERLRVYLTNTLEEAEVVAGPLLALGNQIAREANAASNVKTDCPIMVVLGNPPYSGLSANMNQWTDDLLKKKLPGPNGAPSFYTCDGKPLGEKKLWLQDDYVKFIRFAQYRIERTGYGVLGFITNHSYLDNPTFRGMRQSLMHTFDDIYILDLHGNAKKKETAPDGSKDDNVFDIMQGVAIGLFIKRKSGVPKKPAKVSHAEVWGTRELKYEWLFDHDAQTHKWKRLKPNSPHYFFVPRNESGRGEYEQWPSITGVFPNNVTGIVTARDDFVIDFADKPLLQRIAELRDPEQSDAEIRAEYFEGKGSAKYRPGDSRGWKLPAARKAVQRDADWRKRCVDILYRPFDKRRIYYVPWMVDWPRTDLMPSILAGKNLVLSIGRAGQVIGADVWDIVHCTDAITEFNFFRRGGNTLFPLYLYPNGNELIQASPWPPGKGGRRTNLSPEFVAEFGEKSGLAFVPDGVGDLKKTFGPEDVFRYAYAVFHSPTYRSRYAEFLKIDFPRIPLTSDRKLFARLCAFGAELVGLHLLEQVPAPKATYPQTGDSVVDKPHYKPPTDEANGRVYVNSQQYFDSVPPEVWDFHIGGYQVCQKWLKDRKGRTLGYDEIQTYRSITESLRQTIRLMGEIDAEIPAWPLE